MVLISIFDHMKKNIGKRKKTLKKPKPSRKKTRGPYLRKETNEKLCSTHKCRLHLKMRRREKIQQTIMRQCKGVVIVARPRSMGTRGESSRGHMQGFADDSGCAFWSVWRNTEFINKQRGIIRTWTVNFRCLRREILVKWNRNFSKIYLYTFD